MIWTGIVVALATLIVAATIVILPRATAQSDRLPALGASYFWAGVNYPWRTYQDFGTGAWGHSGVSHPTTYAEVETDFANMAAQGVRVVKWRIFNDGRYSPEFNEQGYVTGLDDKFFADIDAALEIAEKYDIYLVFGLFASGLWTTACELDGAQIGGRASTLTDPQKRRSLVNNAIIPLLRHVGRNPRVLAYEIIAEPEWGVAELNQDDDERIRVPKSAVQALVLDTATAIHGITGALATLEANRARYMGEWQWLGLDFYTFSWYDWLEPYDPLDQAASTFRLDQPVVIGEFPSSKSEYYDLTQVLDIAYRQGYAGAFSWSYQGTDEYGRFNEVADQHIDWERDHWTEVALSRGEIPAPEAGAALLPQPYAASVLQLDGLNDSVSLDIEVQVREGGDYQLQFFLQPVGERSSNALQEVTASFDPNGSQDFTISFNGLADARAYKINLALFDAAWNLRKWFDGLSTVYLQDGALAPPDLSVRAIEDPCYVQ